VHVVFDGSPQALLELLSLRVPLMQDTRALEAQQRALQAAEELEDAAKTQEEFYPKLPEAWPPMGEGEKVSQNSEGEGVVEMPPAMTQSSEPAQANQEPRTRARLERAISRTLCELMLGDGATAKQERLEVIRACGISKAFGRLWPSMISRSASRSFRERPRRLQVPRARYLDVLRLAESLEKTALLGAASVGK
jgi:hypothetical protein